MNGASNPHHLSHPRHGPRAQDRASTDYRSIDSNGLHMGANRREALTVPSGPHNQTTNGQLRQMPTMSGVGAFEGARSPPGNKNTSHVPCKFFRQGACQAGKACPFMHSNDGKVDVTPCKYFAKGNCKFGAKCALAHILPDGRRVNRPNGAMGGGHLNLGGRVNPQTYHNQDSALASSLLTQQASMGPSSFGHQYRRSGQDEYAITQGPSSAVYINLPTIDTGFTSSYSDPKYGSPRDDMRQPLSPPTKGLSALDAPLPSSFDSQGISWIARHGAVAASVPSKFGLDSLPSSLPQKAGPPSDALSNLHDSAFGEVPRSSLTNNASSPPPGSEDYSGQRIMHSQRVSKAKMLSASLPRIGGMEDWDDNFAFEEEFLPESLQELLTPQEKMRRFSRTEEDGATQRQSLSGFGTPGETSSKVGSPATSSPSRFGALFSRQHRKEEENTTYPNTGFGHVGSPLRNSSLHPGASPSLRAVSRSTSGDVSPYLASPPRQSSMSMISQQLQRTRLSKQELDSGSGLHPGVARYPSGSTNGRLDRALSSSSIGNGRIDEEQGDFVFSMEEEDDGKSSKRYSGGWNYPVGGRSPRLSSVSSGKPGVTGHDGKENREYVNGMDSLYGR
ncbi:MAG: hypothetical protein M1836_000053 [Candelina mexicana]|nr:MAG: hypothetical protein M1836_000053 [Candelina mexicana]